MSGPGCTSLARELTAAGWTTAGFVSSRVLAGRSLTSVLGDCLVEYPMLSPQQRGALLRLRRGVERPDEDLARALGWYR